ncbi:MAG: hypothetical protein KKF50_03555 [Nanoarchaeota archaeon]|nr:hypothetical protein [Nanoarchaeota archaeon]
MKKKKKSKNNPENLSESELKILKGSRELYELKQEIHQTLNRLIIKTGLGEIEEGYADDLNFDIGGCSIYSGGYYQQLMITDEEGEEHELDNDLINVRYLSEKIKKREKEFDNLIKDNGLKKANKVFEKPLEMKFENISDYRD